MPPVVAKYAKPDAVKAVVDAYGKTEAADDVAVKYGATGAVNDVMFPKLAFVAKRFVENRLVVVEFVKRMSPAVRLPVEIEPDEIEPKTSTVPLIVVEPESVASERFESSMFER